MFPLRFLRFARFTYVPRLMFPRHGPCFCASTECAPLFHYYFAPAVHSTFAFTLSQNVPGSSINVPAVHESWSHWFPLVPTGNWLPLIRIGYPCSHRFRWISLVSSVPSVAHWFSLVPLSSHRFPLGPTGSHKFPQHTATLHK